MIETQEDVIYISYRNDKEVKELWRVSPVTKIAEFIVQPDNVFPPLRKELTKKEQKENEKREKKRQEKIITPFEQYTEYYKSCSKKASLENINYITEYLLPLGYCDFEKEGDQLHFKHYDDDDFETTMKTKTCTECGTKCIICIDKTICVHCENSEMVG